MRYPAGCKPEHHWMKFWFHKEQKAGSLCSTVHGARDQVAPSPGTGPPLESPAFLAEPSASGSPPAAWQWPQPEESPERLPPPDGHPLASQKPAGQCGSPRLHTAALIQSPFGKTAPLLSQPPPERADHRSPPPDQTRHKHCLGCPTPLAPARRGGSPGSLQAWFDQLHSVLQWSKFGFSSIHCIKTVVGLLDQRGFVAFASEEWVEGASLSVCHRPFKTMHCLYTPSKSPLHTSKHPDSQWACKESCFPGSSGSTPLFPGAVDMSIYLLPCYYSTETVSPGTLVEARGGTGGGNNLKNSALPLSTFLLFRALVLHTSTGGIPWV